MSRNSNSPVTTPSDIEKLIKTLDAQKKARDVSDKLDTSKRSNKSFAQSVIDVIGGRAPTEGDPDDLIAYIKAGIQAYHQLHPLPDQELSSIFQIFDIILKLGHRYEEIDPQVKAKVLDLITQALEYPEQGTSLSDLNQLMQSKLDVLKADVSLILKFSSIFELGFLQSQTLLQQFLFKSLLITLMLNNDVTLQEITHGNWDQSNLNPLSEFQGLGLSQLKGLFLSKLDINLPESFRQKLLSSALQLRFDQDPIPFDDLEKNQMIDYLRDDQKQSLYRSFKQGLGDLTFEPVNIYLDQSSFSQNFDELLTRYNQLKARGEALGQTENWQKSIDRIGVLNTMQVEVKTIWEQNQVTVSLLGSLAGVLNNENCPEVYKQSLRHKYNRFGASINISSMKMGELELWLAESNSRANNALPDGLKKALRQKLEEMQAAALAASEVIADTSGPENLAAASAAPQVSAHPGPSVVLSASVSNDGLESNVLGGNMKVSVSGKQLQLTASSAPPAESTLDNQFLKVMQRIHQFQVKLAPKINNFESRRVELLKVFQSREDQQEEIEKLKRIQIYLESLETGKISDVKQEDKSFFAIELKGCWKSCGGKLEADTVSDDERIKKYSNLLKGFLQAKQSAPQDPARRLSSSHSTFFSRQATHQAPSLFPKDMLVLNQECLNAESELPGLSVNEASKQKLKNIINQYKSFWPGPSSFAEAALKTSLQTAGLVNSYDGVKAFLDQNPNKAADYSDFAVTKNMYGQVSALASKAALTADSAKAMLEEFLAFNYEGPVYVAASSKNDFDLAIEAAKALASDTSLKVIVSFGNQKREIEVEKADQTLSPP